MKENTALALVQMLEAVRLEMRAASRRRDNETEAAQVYEQAAEEASMNADELVEA